MRTGGRHPICRPPSQRHFAGDTFGENLHACLLPMWFLALRALLTLTYLSSACHSLVVVIWASDGW